MTLALKAGSFHFLLDATLDFFLYSGRSHGFLTGCGVCCPPFLRLNPFSGFRVSKRAIQRTSAAFASSSVSHISSTSWETASFPYLRMAFGK